MIDTRTLGIVAALTSALSWAVGSILFKKLGEFIPPLMMTLFKGNISVIFLGLYLFFDRLESITLQPLILLIISGVLGIAIGDTLFFEALQSIGAHTLLILMMLGQVLTVLLAVIFLQESPTLSTWMGIALVLTGITVVLVTKLEDNQQKSQLRGICFGLASVLCMSSSIIIAKIGLGSISTIQATFIRMLSGTLGIFCFGLVTRRLSNWQAPFSSKNRLGFFLISVLIVTFGGFWLSLVSIKYLDVSTANTLNSIEPLFVLPLAAIFLKEKITPSAVVGTFISLAGIVLLCKETN